MFHVVVRGFVWSAFVALLSFSVEGIALADQGDCGQPSSIGASPVASDALFVLGAAVGSRACELCVCDVTNDGVTTASDALTVLAAAVGQPVSLDCPSCTGGPVSCFESQAPTCGGTCEDQALTCVQDPEDPDQCECLDACEASAAPSCGGSCSATDPEAICTSISISPAGLGSIEVCECLPPGIAFCEDADSPGCEGQCAVGSVCGTDGAGGCQCTAQPIQPDCSQAAAPACLGVCDDTQDGSFLCASDGANGCICAPFAPENETCFQAGAPTCGGVCSFGEFCTTESGDCECVAECELSNAPACGGDCYEDGESCIVTTITVGGESRDFCECWSGN